MDSSLLVKGYGAKSLALQDKNHWAIKITRTPSYCTFGQCSLLKTMTDTEETQEKIQADRQKIYELKQKHGCLGARCLVCSSCYNPALRYLISKEKKATCN